MEKDLFYLTFKIKKASGHIGHPGQPEAIKISKKSVQINS